MQETVRNSFQISHSHTADGKAVACYQGKHLEKVTFSFIMNAKKTLKVLSVERALAGVPFLAAL